MICRPLCIAGTIVALLSTPAPAANVDRDGTIVGVFERARLLDGHGEPARAYSLLNENSPEWNPEWFAFTVRVLTEMKRYAEAESLLAEHTPMVDDDEVFLYYLQRARLNQLAGRDDRALLMLAEIDSIANPQFAPYRELIRVDVMSRKGQGAEAARRARQALKSDLPESVLVPMREVLAQALARSGNESDAVSQLRELGRSSRDPYAASRFLHTEYEVFAEAGMTRQATAAAVRLVEEYPGYAGTATAVAEVSRSVRMSDLKDSDLLALGGYQIRKGNTSTGAKMLKALETRRLSSGQKEELRILRAEYHYRVGSLREAIDESRPRYADDGRRRRSILLMARSYRRLGELERAARMYEYFAKEIPNDGKAAEALFVAARLYQELGQTSSMARVENLLRKSYPSTEFGRRATVSSARLLSRAGDDNGAIALLQRRVKRSRYTDEAALYYLARTYGKIDDNDNRNLFLGKLEALDPFSFYLDPEVPLAHRRLPTESNGLISLSGKGGVYEFLDRAESARNDAFGRIESAVAGRGVRAPESYDACLERGVWFLNAGFREWGESELESARVRCFDSPDAMLVLARVYEDHAMPWQSVRLYQKVHDSIPWRERRQYNQDFRWLLYPTPYPLQVLENSVRYALPPHLVYAMMREESKFDHGAVSRVGALGLMQLMPGTARRVAREMELSDWNEERLLDPEINLAFGVWYASSLLSASSGNELQMLAAYNAGPGNAARWFDGESSEQVEAVESIDFRETRNYVIRIVESAKIYHSLYFDVGDEPATVR